MGGRIASQLVAEGKLPVGRLILLGYPLHPLDRKKKLRDAHFTNIKVPMRYFAGTGNSLCDLELLKNVLKRLKTSCELEATDTLKTSESSQTDAFAFHVFTLTHFADKVKIFGDRLYILEKDHEMCVYEYRIVEMKRK